MKVIFRWFIEHPKLVNLFLILVLIMGSISFMNLKRNSTPNVDFKMMFVTTIYPGAAPEDVEVNVTIPIEEQIQEVAGIKEMQSFSGENYSLVFVEIDPEAKDVEQVKTDINKAVDRVAGLPKEILDKPLVTELKTDIFPVFEVAISGNHNISELELRKYAKMLEDKIKLLSGVGGTEKVGYRKREVHIEVDPVLAASNYVSLAEVMGAIQATNIRMSGGDIQSLTTKKKVITLSQFDEPLEVKNVIVRSAFSGERIYVSEVAEVKEGFDEETILVNTNSEPCINIIISKKANADAVRVARRVKTLLDKCNQDLPEGVHAQIVKDYSIYVNAMLRAVISNAIIGFLLVILCLMIFLDHRVAFWTALGIPFSLLVAFYFMPIYNISVTSIALLAFVIVLGMLVDDAIVVAEHIYSFREKGMDPVEASVKGISEIFWPVCATVTTTIAAFLPILLMGGIWGDFIRAMPIVITVVLLASLFESAFILPSHLAHTKLKEKSKPKLLIFLEKIYRRNLLRVLRRKYVFIGIFIAIFLFAILVVLPMIGFELFSSHDADIVMIKIQTPKGTPLRETHQRVKEIENIVVKTVPEKVLSSYVTTIGQKGTDLWDSASGVSQGHWARLDINLIPTQKRKITSEKISDDLEKVLADIKNGNKFTEVTVVAMRGGPPTGKPIDVSFIGNDDKIRAELGDQFEAFLTKTDGVFDIVRTDEEGLNELNIKLNQGLMNELGITAADVAGVIRAAITGNVVTSIRKEGEEIDYRVMLKDKYRNNPDYIKNLTIPNRIGKLIRLGSFIRFEEKTSPIGIYHSEGDRVLEITAEIDTKKVNAREFNKVIKEKFEPIVTQYPGFRLYFGGEERVAEESLANFFNAMLLALIVIYIILVVLFNSFTEPAIVMLAIPFGLAGVIFAFALHHETMSFLGLIGILGLAGVVVNNSLVMLKFLNKKEDEICSNGEHLTLDHIADAAMLRFRPITLTTITTVAGLLPSLYGFFGGRIDFLFPLLLALCWGLVFSTFITLFLIPSFYIVERDLNIWFSARMGFFANKKLCRIDFKKK
ncbi:MAG: efflux RND transporter permease subunit [Candidatus Margulisbacteria bacterium]|nr:efflux RND transporter permease subunit [Candidatus Margulisiibacteriota bacterium]MBU1022202.1 efflux RND transporter permease subunit [Candidatus Margulisiibacteriota bacterium]MBU1729359.1 efflux RND transporter permease subunit [Candidatus Margulisiibacteriota bacterium]MBU1955632.1 efflux RND transporter permease subunit [Candidatus Margulisiibacteriota bacterium]